MLCSSLSLGLWQAWLWEKRTSRADLSSPPWLGLSGAAKCMPAFHQLLGFAKHLIPVLQFSAAGVHVGAHHHPAQLVTPCGGGRTWSFSEEQKPHPLSHPQGLPSLLLTPSLKGSSQPPPSLTASKGVLTLLWSWS